MNMVARLAGSAVLSTLYYFHRCVQAIVSGLGPRAIQKLNWRLFFFWPLGGAKSPVGVPLKLGN